MYVCARIYAYAYVGGGGGGVFTGTGAMERATGSAEHVHTHINRYWGNGESHVFRLRPRPRIYRWAPSKDVLMMLVFVFPHLVSPLSPFIPPPLVSSLMRIYRKAPSEDLLMKLLPPPPFCFPSFPPPFFCPSAHVLLGAVEGRCMEKLDAPYCGNFFPSLGCTWHVQVLRETRPHSNTNTHAHAHTYIHTHTHTQGTTRTMSIGAEGGPAIWLDDELQQVFFWGGGGGDNILNFSLG
jgi:hypothetical protein